MKTGSKELVILSYAIVCFHPSVSLNNEKICCAISEDKIAICEKTAGLGSGNFSDLNSACRRVLVPVKIFQFQGMLNESVRYRDRTNGLVRYHYYIFALYDQNTGWKIFTKPVCPPPVF